MKKPEFIMCRGEACLVKAYCKRFTYKSEEYFQSYFFESPVEPDGKTCRFMVLNDSGKKNEVTKVLGTPRPERY